MKQLPTYNAIIKYTMGAGFKTLLPKLLSDVDLVITSKICIDQYIRNGLSGDVLICTPYQLKSLQTQSYQRVIVDIRLPKLGTKLVEQLRQKCEGRVVLITQLVMLEDLPSLAYITGMEGLQFQSINGDDISLRVMD